MTDTERLRELATTEVLRRLKTCEEEKVSLRLECAAMNHARINDNTYLLEKIRSLEAKQTSCPECEQKGTPQAMTDIERLRALVQKWRLQAEDFINAPTSIVSATAGGWLGKCADELDAELAALPASVATTLDSGWQPIETAPMNEIVVFWVVRERAEESSYCDTSGKPIVSTHDPYLCRGKFNAWGSLSKATHWRHDFAAPLPEPELKPSRGDVMGNNEYGKHWNLGEIPFFGRKKLSIGELDAEALEWRQAALRVGESLDSVGQPGYYNQTPARWRDWALAAVWHKQERIKALRKELTDLKAFYYRDSATPLEPKPKP